jgi:hypothetical protein
MYVYSLTRGGRPAEIQRVSDSLQLEAVTLLVTGNNGERVNFDTLAYVYIYTYMYICTCIYMHICTHVRI